MRYILCLSAVLILLLSVPQAQASEDAEKVSAALQIAEKDMQEMASAKMPTIRYNDALLVARQLYETQLALEQSGKKADYSQIYEKLKELKDIRQNAFTALDELKVLRQDIDRISGIDRAPVIELYDRAKTECESERYEMCHEAIDRTYEKISELEATQTKIKAFYDATSLGISDFIRQRWREMILWNVFVLVSLRLTYNRVIYWSIAKEIEGMEQRRDVVKELIAKTQKEYFEEGKISDTAYYVRTKKYGELLRDINRQIPLLNEELALRRNKIFSGISGR